MRKTAVVTCSSACIPADLVNRLGIRVVPMTLIVDGKPYRDGIDMSAEDFYRALTEDYSKVSTSAPSVGDYLEVFTAASADCEQVLCITLADNFSASYKAASGAASMCDAVPVTVFDSGTAATAQGLVVLRAAERALAGAPLDDVLEAAREAADGVKLVAVVGTLEFLRASGRVNSVSAFAAGALNIKPVFKLDRGEAKPLAKTRSKRRALEKIARLAVSTYREEGPLELAVFHVMAEQEARFLEKRILEEAECGRSFIAEFTPVMGRHTGPGLVGASFCPRPRR